MSFDSESKVWTGIASPYLFGGQGLGEVIWEFMDENPDHIMQINDSEDDVYLCERMKTVSMRIVDNLVLKKVHSGDTIALVLKNHHLDAPILVACCFLGVTMCVLPHNLNVDKYKHIIDEIKPKMILITEPIIGKSIFSAGIVSKVNAEVYILNNDLPTCQELGELINFKVQVTDDFNIYHVKDPTKEVALITVIGNGNGIRLLNLSHKMILRSIKPEDLISSTIASTSDLSLNSHVIRTLQSFLRPVTRIISTSEFHPASFLQTINKYDVNEVILDMPIPNTKALIDYVKNEDLTIKYVEKISVFTKDLKLDVLESLDKYFLDSKIVWDLYIEEIGGRFTYKTNDSNGKGNSLGKLDSHLSAKIVVGNDTLLGPDEVGVGEIWIAGCGFNFSGYLNGSELNKRFGEDGYFNTGKTGYFDLDGNLHLVETPKPSPVKGRTSK